MIFKNLVFQMLIAAYGVAVQEPIYDFAASLPYDEALYINNCQIADLNGDGMPEVYLAASSDWEYRVYYYMNGEVFVVDDMKPWAWSSRLCHTDDGRLVMCAAPHTTGTEGIMQYRIYAWGDEGCYFTEDLWRLPSDAMVHISGEPEGESAGAWTKETENRDFYYISADRCIDPWLEQVEPSWLISQEEYESKVNGLNEMTDVLNTYQSGQEKWGWEWWKEHDNPEEIYMTIEAELLNWQQ